MQIIEHAKIVLQIVPKQALLGSGFLMLAYSEVPTPYLLSNT
jgi:hypothetical protein